MASIPTFPAFAMEPVPVVIESALIRLGYRIALARGARELRQEDLAELAGVSRSTVKALEAGQPGVAIGTLLKVMKAMELLEQADQLLDPEKDPAMAHYAQRQLVSRPSS
jgi:transcriptional regulator with XRE-family HTH domain